MVNVQRQGYVNMKKRKLKKPKRDGKFKPKEINIDALEINIRKNTPGAGIDYSCFGQCRGGFINRSRFRKRIFRKESAYISR